MYSIIRIVGFSITGVIILNMLGNYGAGAMSVQAIGRIIIVSIIMLTFLPKISSIFEMITHVANLSHINDIYFKTIMKVIGISYVSEYASSICTDMGETAIANKINIAGKVGILYISVPIINALLSLIESI